MNNIEDVLANEIQRQGFRATPDAFREMLTECIGRIDDSGAFVLFPYPNEEGVRSLALGDFIKGYRQTNPDSFVSIDTAKPENHRYTGLTQSYLEENRRTKLRPHCPDDRRTGSRSQGLGSMTKTVNQIRFETMERARAFAEVLSLRDKLSGARNRLAFVEADLVARSRQPTDNRDRISDHVADLTRRLAKAEAYCLQVNPDQLREHDAKIAAAEEVAKAARMAEEAAHEIARREAAAKAEADGQARLMARKRRELEAIESE